MTRQSRGRGPRKGVPCVSVDVTGLGRLLMAMVLLLCVPTMGSSADGDTGVVLPNNPLEGRQLFEVKHCSRCHAVTEEESGVGPSLGAGRFEGTFLDLGAGLWNHVPGMGVMVESAGLDWPDLSDDEVVELLVFLYALKYLGRPGDPDVGARLFETRGCSSCHSIGGGVGVGPDLATTNRFASPLYVARQIWNHGPSMLESIATVGVERPKFDPGDLADLSAFLRQRSQRPPDTQSLLLPGNPNAGRRLFSTKGCAGCHGEDGRGGTAGPGLQRAELHLSAEAIAGTMWNHALEMLSPMRRKGIAWPTFEAGELADLVAYLYFIPFSDPPGSPQDGERIFSERSCGRCHSDDAVSGGRLDVEAPVLVGEMVAVSAPEFVAALWNHAPVMKQAILAEGEPWPELSGREMRDLLVFLSSRESSLEP